MLLVCNHSQSFSFLTFSISTNSKSPSTNFTLCPALTEYAWVTLKEAKSYDLIEGIYEKIEILDKILNKKEKVEWSNPKA